VSDPLGNALDREGIRDRAHRYSDAINRRDSAVFGACFAPDGRWRVLGPRPRDISGRDAITAAIGARLEQLEVVVQLVHSIVVDAVDGDRARSRTTVSETVRSAGGADGFRMIGIYDDELVRDGGRWVYATRTFHPLYIESEIPPGLAFPF
jgi:ketosteroid isomerase-like protein